MKEERDLLRQIRRWQRLRLIWNWNWIRRVLAGTLSRHSICLFLVFIFVSVCLRRLCSAPRTHSPHLNAGCDSRSWMCDVCVAAGYAVRGADLINDVISNASVTSWRTRTIHRVMCMAHTNHNQIISSFQHDANRSKWKKKYKSSVFVSCSSGWERVHLNVCESDRFVVVEMSSSSARTSCNLRNGYEPVHWATTFSFISRSPVQRRLAI